MLCSFTLYVVLCFYLSRIGNHFLIFSNKNVLKLFFKNKILYYYVVICKNGLNFLSLPSAKLLNSIKQKYTSVSTHYLNILV